ncbi:MAG: hypothetical protein U0350_36370 [Caldilineaceae bacterium]
MSVKASKARILVDQYDFSLQSSGYSLNTEVKALEFATLQQGAGQLKVPGNGMANLEHNGFVATNAAGQIEYELSARLGTETPCKVALILGTNLTVPVAYMFESSFNQQLKVNAPFDNLLTLSGNWAVGDKALVRGYQVAGPQTISATGALVGIDFGAAGSNGGKAFLQVQTITGTASGATIKVQSDTASDFGTAADEGTFTFSAAGMYAIDLSGTVSRYVRLNCTSKGGATSFRILGLVAIKGVTY